MEETIPYNMKLPVLSTFNGEGDPRDHTSRFTATMGLLSVSDAILRRVFPTTLTGTAQRWYNKLKPGSVKSFTSLSTEFLNRYLTNIPAKTTTSILRSCIQEEGETLRSYIEQFNKQAMKIDNLNVDMATEALREGTRFGKLVDKLLINKPTTFSNLMGIAQKYFELDKGRRAIRGKEAKGKESKEKSKEKSKSKSQDRRGRPEESRRFAPQTRYEPGYDPRDDESNFTPLSTNRTNVLMWIKDNVKNVVWPPKMKAEIRDTRKYYKFHEDHGHETDSCRDLKVEIERMIDTGELRKLVAHKPKNNDKGEKRSRDYKGKEKEDERSSKILGTIHMINGGGHSSSTIRRKQRKEVMNIRETHMSPVIFDVEDYEHVKAPHNDDLVVTTIIEN
ncbi:uncharacterized protein LOC126681927 [Mercurialis annua]|uniref:uncharacterized protein LOC126681927 n=1 Tax=Mercurialis annua TaxID=3986 RepID=UPI00215EAFB3|nr:uncharacterized protein LOC126681927 [Mercurialis annua]